MDAENLIAFIISIAVGIYMLNCLFRPEDL